MRHLCPPCSIQIQILIVLPKAGSCESYELSCVVRDVMLPDQRDESERVNPLDPRTSLAQAAWTYVMGQQARFPRLVGGDWKNQL
jgi:hypothetical protein